MSAPLFSCFNRNRFSWSNSVHVVPTSCSLQRLNCILPTRTPRAAKPRRRPVGCLIVLSAALQRSVVHEQISAVILVSLDSVVMFASAGILIGPSTQWSPVMMVLIPQSRPVTEQQDGNKKTLWISKK